jgi:hypothetical protein
MINTAATAAPPPDYAHLVRELVIDGWTVTAQTRPNAPNLVTTLVQCPSAFLRVRIETNTDNGAVHSTIGTITGGPQGPGRWRAAADAPPEQLWLAAVRAARHAQHNHHQPGPYNPGAVLRVLGWNHGYTSNAGRVVERYADNQGRSLTYRYPQKSTSAMWIVTRPETTIGVMVSAAEPYALPALVLALILGELPSATRSSQT